MVYWRRQITGSFRKTIFRANRIFRTIPVTEISCPMTTTTVIGTSTTRQPEFKRPKKGAKAYPKKPESPNKVPLMMHITISTIALKRRSANPI